MIYIVYIVYTITRLRNNEKFVFPKLKNHHVHKFIFIFANVF